MNYDFSDKNILITGAAAGLGLAMAEHLADLGANLALTDINTDAVTDQAKRLDTNSRGQIIGFSHDVSSETSWADVYKEVSSEWSQLDGLVNNAGIMMHVPFVETTLEMFRKTQSVNLDSVFIGVQTFLPMLKRAGEVGDSASIVNLSSIFGQVSGIVHSAYSASKGGVRLLSKSIAVELPRDGYNVRCNSLHPGIMDTGVSEAGMHSEVEAGNFSTVAEAIQNYSSTVPMKRPGRAQEIAAGVAYLLSPLSSYMTGSELTLDGGYCAQ